MAALFFYSTNKEKLKLIVFILTAATIRNKVKIKFFFIQFHQYHTQTTAFCVFAIEFVVFVVRMI